MDFSLIIFMNILKALQLQLAGLWHKQKQIKHPKLLGFLAFILLILLYVISSLSSLRVFLPYYGDLSGFPFSNKTYLIVFQNNHELRPAGGFISSYGIAKFSHGVFAGLDVSDVYGDISNTPYMDPPYPMEKLLKNADYPGYTFRDANYNPDYPKTAAELVRMLHITQPNTTIDGVIAVNYSFLEDLIGALGSINVDNKTFTKENLFESLENEVNNFDLKDYEQWKNRKGILKPLAQAIIKKIVLSPLKLRKVSDTVAHSLATKEIQLYFTDTSLEKMVTDQGWSGSWPKNIQSDFLAVNEANLGGMKSDRYIKRDVTYHLKIEENPATGKMDLIGETTIQMHHYGIYNVPLSGEYKGFVRTYVPAGAKLLDSSKDYKNDLWQEDSGPYHVFGNVVKLNPGEKTELYYKYSLPMSVLKNNNYSLFIPKQSGTNQDYYTVIVEAPPGFEISSSIFNPQENIGVYQNEISSDLNLSFTLLPDKNPPRVVYQVMDSIGKISIGFNEDIANSTSEDPLNYSFKDLDAKHPETTDQLYLDHITHGGNGITLYVNGMTDQPLERYSVTFKNLSDLHGNLIEPDPKTVTVIQKFN